MFCGEPEVHRTIDEVNDYLRSSTASIRSRLESLSAKGFLRQVQPGSDRYMYKPVNDDLDRGAQRLCVAYKERRLRVIEAIFSKPLAGIREFAEAFKFKGGKNE